ncbi:MAG: phosphatidylglycerol lysyltransferase domain-containing protein, partial [Chloroflexota bacterium]
LFLVRGLLRGYRGAYVMTMALFVASALAHPLKGGDYEEAVISVILMVLLFGARKAFTRQGRVPLGWELALAVGVASLAMYLVIGFAAVDPFSLSHDSWMTFAYDAQANRFIRAGMLLGLVVFLQVGGGDKAVWFWEPGDGGLEGVVLYQCFDDKMVVFKDPVLSPKADPVRLLEDLFRYAEMLDVEVDFSMITGSWMEHLHDFGYHFVKVTEEAVVPLDDFSLKGGKNAGLRRTMHAMERAEVTYAFMEPPFAQETIDQLRTVSDAWLDSKGGREMQFSPCYFSPEYIQRNPVAVARDASGRIIAFLNVLITRPGGPAMFDFIRYLPEAIDNAIDFVIVRTLALLAEQGYASFSLGGAPMSDVGTRRQARLAERVMRLFSLRAEGLFNFKGLQRYKSKFHPQWSPRYLAYPKPWDWASALVAYVRLVQAGSREARGRIAAARLGRTP